MHDQRHANLLPLFASFVSFNHLWMVMPFVSGGSVMDIIQASFHEACSDTCTQPQESAALSWTAVQGFDDVSVATIGLCVCRALDYMHSRGRIHRDIKVGAFWLCGSTQQRPGQARAKVWP